jgi:hypothetical protein
VSDLTLHASLTAAPAEGRARRGADRALRRARAAPGRAQADQARRAAAGRRRPRHRPVRAPHPRRGAARGVPADRARGAPRRAVRAAADRRDPDGDLLLAEIRGGVREGVSVELSEVAYDPADPDLVISARLDAVAHVPLPAYDSARVSALAAALHDDQGDSVSDPPPGDRHRARRPGAGLHAAGRRPGAAPDRRAGPGRAAHRRAAGPAGRGPGRRGDRWHGWPRCRPAGAGRHAP